MAVPIKAFLKILKDVYKTYEWFVYKVLQTDISVYCVYTVFWQKNVNLFVCSEMVRDIARVIAGFWAIFDQNFKRLESQ